MSLVIVTKRVFLICEDIVSIVLQQNSASHEDPVYTPSLPKSANATRAKANPGRKKKKQNKAPAERNRNESFNLCITYLPLGASRNAIENHCVAVDVFDKEDAERVFADVVREVREQKPDQLYLDSMVDRIFNSEPSV